ERQSFGAQLLALDGEWCGGNSRFDSPGHHRRRIDNRQASNVAGVVRKVESGAEPDLKHLAICIFEYFPALRGEVLGAHHPVEKPTADLVADETHLLQHIGVAECWIVHSIAHQLAQL